MNVRLAAAGVLLVLAAAVGIHQELFTGCHWDWGQVLDSRPHHEHVTLILIVLAIVVLLVNVGMGRFRRLVAGVLASAGLVAGVILILEGLWALDFAMWYRSFHVYYPWCWGCHYGKGGMPLGVGVNIKYYQIAIATVLSVISAYVLGWLSHVGRCTRLETSPNMA